MARQPKAQREVELASVFAALGDPVRMQLVHKLGQDQIKSIAQLAAGIDLSHQGVTKHLQVLEQVGLVTSRRVGREKHFTGVPEPVRHAQACLEEISSRWDVALGRLKDMVETG